MSTQQPESLQLAHVCDHPIPPDWSDMVAAVKELLRLHAENEALQQVYDARQLEIDHLRGATKMMEPAQPVAWLVYLPSIDTQNVYDSQDDPGYVDDVTNHDDAVVTPLYQMEVPAGHALVPVTGITATPTTRAAPKSAPVAQGDAEDAARYRWIAANCRSTSEHWGGRWSIVVEGPAPKSHDSEDDFDAAIDAARGINT